LGKTFTAFMDGQRVENFKELAGRPAKTGELQAFLWAGRTDQDRRVVVESSEDLAGRFVRVEFTDLYYETFRGKLV